MTDLPRSIPRQTRPLGRSYLLVLGSIALPALLVASPLMSWDPETWKVGHLTLLLVLALACCCAPALGWIRAGSLGYGLGSGGGRILLLLLGLLLDRAAIALGWMAPADRGLFPLLAAGIVIAWAALDLALLALRVLGRAQGDPARGPS